MEMALGILGLTFGSVGFIFGLSAIAGFKKLTEELKALRKEVHQLGGPGA